VIALRTDSPSADMTIADPCLCPRLVSPSLHGHGSVLPLQASRALLAASSERTELLEDRVILLKAEIKEIKVGRVSQTSFG